VKILRISFCSAISCAHDPGYFQTSISFALFYLSNRRSYEKLILVTYSVLTDFCHYLCLPLDHFLFEFFDHRTFEEVATVAYALMDGIFKFETEPKE
jgi:hypothetical protein